MNGKYKLGMLSLYLSLFLPGLGFSQQWTPVPAADLAALSASDFADDELDLPYYVKHFHRLANSVVESGPEKGFINIAVWRNLEDNKPYNARIMENIISLAFFYSTKRPWNPYYNSAALKPRLEAAINFLCSIQHPTGAFSEYGKEKWNLAAAAFATKFIGGTLVLLKNGPAINPEVMKKLVEADRKTIMFVLNDPELYETGKYYSNQFTNVWAGAFAYLSLYPDAEMQNRLSQRMKQSLTDFQSPAGYFYEAGGIDFSYNFHTHHSNLWMSYHYSRGTELGNLIIEAEKRFYDWISYNSTREPGTNTYTVNKAIEMRQRAAVVGSYFTESPLSEEAKGVRAFNKTAKEIKSNLAAQRTALERNWPNVPELQTGEFRAYDPYVFLHREHYTWYPDEAQRQAAIAELPYLKSKGFIHQKKDKNHPIVFTYIREQEYYAVFNSGATINQRQRFGLGLLWSPSAGTFLQSQSNTDSAAWGTMPAQGKLYEADTLEAVFLKNGKPVKAETGNHDLGSGPLDARYTLGSTGSKSISFTNKEIKIVIKHPGEFTEAFPFLVNKNDWIALTGKGQLTLRKNGTIITLSFGPSAKAELRHTPIVSGSQQVVMLYLHATDNLRYAFRMMK